MLLFDRHEKTTGTAFFSLQKHKKSGHGKFPRIRDITVDLEPFMGEYQDKELLEELTAFHFFWLILSSSEVDTMFPILHQLNLLPVS